MTNPECFFLVSICFYDTLLGLFMISNKLTMNMIMNGGF